MPEQQTHELPEDVRRWVQARLQAIDATRQQLNGAIGMYCETHGMADGVWALSEDGTTLTKQETSP